METTPEKTNLTGSENVEQVAPVTINQEKLNAYIEQLKLDQNLSVGVVTGFVAALISAALWALITVSTGYQIGYMAIAVGLIVGFTIRKFGKGFDQVFGIAGAVLALLGCLLGNYLSMVGFYAREESINFFELLMGIDTSIIPDIMIESFSPIDLLFYGLAIYEGYKFSFRQLTEQEILENGV